MRSYRRSLGVEAGVELPLPFGPAVLLASLALLALLPWRRADLRSLTARAIAGATLLFAAGAGWL